MEQMRRSAKREELKVGITRQLTEDMKEREGMAARAGGAWK